LKLFGLKILSPLVYVIAVILLQAPALLLAQTPEQTEQLQQEHERKKEEKRSLEEQRNTIIQKEQGVLQKLQEIESKLAANEKQLARYQQEIENHTLEAAELQRELGELLSKDKKQKKLAIKRIRAIYKLGYNKEDEHFLKILFGAQDMQDLVEKYKYMDVIAEADQAMLKQIQLRQVEIAQKSAELIHLIQLAQGASKAAQIERSRLLVQEQKRQQLLYEYRTEKGTHNQALKELRAAGAQLEKRLGIVSNAGLEEQAEMIKSVRPALFGKLPWPVVGVIVPNQRDTDRGLTIRARKGKPVSCVADGIVATIESIVGYGNTVVVMHGNGYTSVYAHLSRISVKRGDTVQVKQILGTVGETGSLIGPVLYFQLWKYPKSLNAPPEPLNTRRWLTRKMS
jgi:murein DD-endopeptidase MepM/ murein hydrolase activator NlpD